MAAKMTERQKDIRKAVAACKKGSTGVVTTFGAVINDYWNKDSHAPHHVQFLLNELQSAGLTTTLNGCKKLIQMYLPVNVTFKKKDKVFEVTNRDKVAKPTKEALKLKCEEFLTLDLTSILNHPQLKVEVAFEWNAAQKLSTKAYMKKRIKAGVPLKDLLDIMQTAATEIAAEEAEDANKAKAE